MKGAFMRELVAYVICAIVVLYGIRESIGTAFEERTLKYSLYKVLYYFSILLTFFCNSKFKFSNDNNYKI